MMAERTIFYKDVPPTNKRNKLLEVVVDGDQSTTSVGAALILQSAKHFLGLLSSVNFVLLVSEFEH